MSPSAQSAVACERRPIVTANRSRNNIHEMQLDRAIAIQHVQLRDPTVAPDSTSLLGWSKCALSATNSALTMPPSKANLSVSRANSADFGCDGHRVIGQDMLTPKVDECVEDQVDAADRKTKHPVEGPFDLFVDVPRQVGVNQSHKLSEPDVQQFIEAAPTTEARSPQRPAAANSAQRPYQRRRGPCPTQDQMQGTFPHTAQVSGRRMPTPKG